ncbi:MAG: hypothetical protein DRI44_05490 [Chlamydiae bacterium]|nr:MAG: hypothetical protein DRI44_05490 [Chlamydiota bacterium]
MKILNLLKFLLLSFFFIPVIDVQAHPAVGPYQSPGNHSHSGPTNVLVIYNSAWPDENGNGIGDSQEVAEYYAARREIPTNNLLAVSITNFMGQYGPKYGPDRMGEERKLFSTNVTVSYDIFYSNIVISAVLKLNSTNSLTGNLFKNDILFICPVYGMPYYVDTHFAYPAEYPFYQYRSGLGAEFSARLRSLDLMLCNVYRRFYGGIVWTNNLPKPGRAASCPYGYGAFWGDDQVEIGAPSNSSTEITIPLYYGKANNPATAKHFSKLRKEDGNFNYESNGFFLVTRIDAPNADLAKGLVDKAIYAEHYLNNWAGNPNHKYYARLYCGDDPDWINYFTRNLGCDVKNWFLGIDLPSENMSGEPSSVFNTNIANSLPPWDVIYDSRPQEIGENGNKSTVQVKISAMASNTLQFSFATYEDVASWIIPPLENGGVLHNLRSGVDITLQGTNGAGQAYYWVDTTNGCKVGDTMENTIDIQFPITDAVFYTEYYTIDGHNWSAYNYRDCYQWLPGAIGVYNQSWGAFDFRRVKNYQFCGPALTRGITACAGTIAEPLSIGIPFTPRLMRALSMGFSWAESCYNSLYCAESWMTVFIGDPLYNPFLPIWNKQASNINGDFSPPELSVSSMNGKIIVKLTGDSEAQLADVAQFRLFAGYDSNNWSITNQYYNWPYSSSNIWINERDYNYTRGKSWELASPTNWFFYEVIARDPYGNTNSSGIKTMPIPELYNLNFILPIFSIAFAAKKF